MPSSAPIFYLIVDVIEPYHDKNFDHACYSGDMFDNSPKSLRGQHKNLSRKNCRLYDEKIADSERLRRRHMAARGPYGGICKTNSFYKAPHGMVGNLDFDMPIRLTINERWTGPAG